MGCKPKLFKELTTDEKIEKIINPETCIQKTAELDLYHRALLTDDTATIDRIEAFSFSDYDSISSIIRNKQYVLSKLYALFIGRKIIICYW